MLHEHGEFSKATVSLVDWWKACAEVAEQRAESLAKSDERREGSKAHRRTKREQLRRGYAVHLAAIDGVSSDNDSDKLCGFQVERFPHTTVRHFDWLKKKLTPAKHKGLGGGNDVVDIITHRMRIEDCWPAMKSHFKGRFHYKPGDVVEVRGQDLVWHAGVVTYSRAYERYDIEEQTQAHAEKEITAARIKKAGDLVSSKMHHALAFKKLCSGSTPAQESNGIHDPAEVAKFARNKKNLDLAEDAKLAIERLEHTVADLQEAAADNDSEDVTNSRHMVNVIMANNTIELGNWEHEVRPHEDSVRVLFGRAPWLWQQYTLLCAEQKARFKADHSDDFLEFSWKEFAERRFDSWVDGPPTPEELHDREWAKLKKKHSAERKMEQDSDDRPFSYAEYNPDFGAHYHKFDQLPGVQAALRKVIFEPFEAIDLITGGEGEKGGWDFSSEEISAYTYVSVVGGGHIVSLIIAFVQIALPLVLLYATWNNLDQMDTQNNTLMCRGDGHFTNKIAILCVSLMYLTHIVPKQWAVFKSSVRRGGGCSLPPPPPYPLYKCTLIIPTVVRGRLLASKRCRSTTRRSPSSTRSARRWPTATATRRRRNGVTCSTSFSTQPTSASSIRSTS